MSKSVTKLLEEILRNFNKTEINSISPHDTFGPMKDILELVTSKVDLLELSNIKFFNESKQYYSGDVVRYDSLIYKFNSDWKGPWNPSRVDKTTVYELLVDRMAQYGISEDQWNEIQSSLTEMRNLSTQSADYASQINTVFKDIIDTINLMNEMESTDPALIAKVGLLVALTNLHTNQISELFTRVTALESGSPIPSEIKVTDITLNHTTLEMNLGETRQLVTEVSPSNATNKKLLWISGNNSIATVSQSGLVTAVGSGSVDIICMATDGSGVTATCQVASSEAIIPVTNILLSASKTTLYCNGNHAYDRATVSASLIPTNATSKEVTWSVDDPTKALISGNGLNATVTALAPGEIVVKCTSNGVGGCFGTLVINSVAEEVSEYANPVIEQFEYLSQAPSLGGDVIPELRYSQLVTYNSGRTDTISSGAALEFLANPEVTGATVTDISGRVIWGRNPDLSDRLVNVQLNLTLNGKLATANAICTQVAATLEEFVIYVGARSKRGVDTPDTYADSYPENATFKGELRNIPTLLDPSLGLEIFVEATIDRFWLVVPTTSVPDMVVYSMNESIEVDLDTKVCTDDPNFTIMYSERMIMAGESFKISKKSN